jgi:small redox-active disulfide protein 2
MEIKIYGPGCARCHEVHELVLKVLKEHGIEADVEYITDMDRMIQAGFMSTPVLVIDGKLLAQGRVPRKKELVRWLSAP